VLGRNPRSTTTDRASSSGTVYSFLSYPIWWTRHGVQPENATRSCFCALKRKKKMIIELAPHQQEVSSAWKDLIIYDHKIAPWTSKSPPMVRPYMYMSTWDHVDRVNSLRSLVWVRLSSNGKPKTLLNTLVYLSLHLVTCANKSQNICWSWTWRFWIQGWS